jgi:hypothetical protein
MLKLRISNLLFHEQLLCGEYFSAQTVPKYSINLISIHAVAKIKKRKSFYFFPRKFAKMRTKIFSNVRERRCLT